MLSPVMLLPWFPVSVENRDLGDGLELGSVDSDSSRLCLVDYGRLWLVIMPKSKDRFMQQPPMRTMKP
jgi:hypothetical protein